jgi:hypothetical protein
MAFFQESHRLIIKLSSSLMNVGEVVCRVGETIGEQAAWEKLAEIQRLPFNVLSAQDEARPLVCVKSFQV